MAGNMQNLVPINRSVLTVGTKIDFDVYYKRNGQLILLCNDLTFTQADLNKIKKVEGLGNNIYVPKERKNELLAASMNKSDGQKQVEKAIGYDEVKEQTHKMLDFISENKIVSMADAQSIASVLDKKIEAADTALVIQCINNVRTKDEYLFTHSVNVATLNGLLGKWLGFDEHAITILIKIGLLHDIGKLMVPPEILNKPGKLTSEEFEIMKTHSYCSYEMLKASGEIDMNVLLGVKHHHEKMNGLGYPDKLVGTDIPTFARITSISDVYDAMVAQRVYKKARSPFEILEEFAMGEFADLDPKILNTFIKKIPSKLMGRHVLLSDGTVGEVVFMSTNNFAYPLVRVEDDVFQTDKKLYCVSMYAMSE